MTSSSKNTYLRQNEVIMPSRDQAQLTSQNNIDIRAKFQILFPLGIVKNRSLRHYDIIMSLQDFSQ